MATIELKGVNEARRQLDLTADRLDPGIKRTLRQAGELARRHMQTSYLSGSPLRVQTGKLRSNWQVKGRQEGRDYVVVVGTNTSYAAAQNYGVRGTQTVRAHTRRARAPKSGGRGRSTRKRLRQRSEARVASEHRARVNAQSRASHGMSRAQLGVVKRQQRIARGIQRGAFGPRPTAQRSGYVAVRAHDRYMKLPGHRYVERTLRDVAPQVRRLIQRYQEGLLNGEDRQG